MMIIIMLIIPMLWCTGHGTSSLRDFIHASALVNRNIVARRSQELSLTKYNGISGVSAATELCVCVY